MSLRLAVTFLAVASLCAASPASLPTFNKDIAPILYQNCAACHRPGEVAPFSLLTYSDAKRWAPMIAQATADHVMPPWKAAPGFGEFADVRALNDTQIATLAAWAKAGAPEGDAKDAPLPPRFTDGWQLGPPDLVIEMPEAYQVPAGGYDIYQCFVIRTDFPEDTAIASVEVRPGNRRVLHHTVIYTDPTHAGRERAGDAGSYTCYGGPGIRSINTDLMAGWAPGMATKRMPDGVAFVAPKGSDLIVQNHYHPSGKPESDKTTIGIYFQKGPVVKRIFGVPLLQPNLRIPAGEAHFHVAGSFVTPVDLELSAIAPHMHLLGREMKVTATLPSGEVRPLIWIKDWDFNWQLGYEFKESLQLPAKTRLDMEAYFDNSAGNPRNPNSPPKTVSWGEATTEEMCVAMLVCVSPRPGDRMTAWMSLAQQLLSSPAGRRAVNPDR
jgi:mono/diheme cytochrome c family protein